MAIASLSAQLLAYFLSFGGFGWQYSAQTDEKGTAHVELTSDEPLSDVRVKITGSDGNTITKTVSIKAGKPTKITWKQADRQVSYQIEIEANDAFTNGDFSVQRPTAGGKKAAFELLSDRDEIVDRQKIRYKTPFTVSSRTLQVYDTDGDLITEKLITDEVVEAGQTFEMSWNTDREVFMIKVTGEDDTGFSYTDTRVPWSVDVPHTDVNFDSGKSVIKPEEEHKVAEAFAVLVHEIAAIDKVNQAVNGNVVVQLFVVGYTDTVGNGADNQKLSEDRAKAIAKYFLDKGVWCEIYYAGMGERGLAVETADSVDEVRNRRALYILSPQKPAGGGHIPSQGAWKKLADTRPRMLQTLPPLPESYVKHKEEQQRKRTEKFGGGSAGEGDGSGSGGDDEGGGSGGSSGGSGASGEEGGDGSEPYLGGSDTGEKPGGTAKGCSTTEPRQGMGLLGLILGLGFIRRRRSRCRA